MSLVLVTHNETMRRNVADDDSPAVNILDPRELLRRALNEEAMDLRGKGTCHLFCKHTNGAKRELTAAQQGRSLSLSQQSRARICTLNARALTHADVASTSVGLEH